MKMIIDILMTVTCVTILFLLLYDIDIWLRIVLSLCGLYALIELVFFSEKEIDDG